MFHPAERVFLRRDGDPIVYEVDVTQRFGSIYRPQIIDVGPRLISVAGDLDDVARFDRLLARFRARPEVTLGKQGPKRFRVASLELASTVVV